MNSPYAMRKVRIAYVRILGKPWMSRCDVSMDVNLSDHDLENIGEFTRDNVEQWLTSHSGDFSEVTDFTAVCGETEIPWSSEENEMAYLDTISDGE